MDLETPAFALTGAVRPASERLLDGLDPQQRHAVTLDATPLAILAGPGAGKTRVLTRRIAWQARAGAVDPERVLAVTFTRKAAGVLGSRLSRLGLRDHVTAGTFHALALAQLRARAEDAGRRFPRVLPDKREMLLRLDGGRDADARTRALVTARAIEWAKASRIDPEEFAAAARRAGRVDGLDGDELARRYGDYEDERRRRGVVDFDDLLILASDALERDREFAALIHWRFRHLFVDEFQDLTAAQLRLLRGWMSGGATLCVVGDPQQAIYRFAGGDPEHLRAFATRFPGGTTIRLTRNYRSHPDIVETTNAVLETPSSPAAGRDQTVRTRSERRVAIVGFESERDETHGLATRLIAAHSSRPRWNDHAVLTRTNALADFVAPRLEAAGIPVRLRLRDGADTGAEPDDAVDVLTYHRAKGLEWPHVHLPAVEEGTVPIAAAEREADALEEERRLFAVAISRAEESVHISYARRRAHHDRIDERTPSRYLARLGVAGDGPAGDGTGAEATVAAPSHRGFAAARARLAAAGATRRDARIRRALKRWRETRARAAAVAPTSVLADRPLAVIARDRPRSEADLAAIGGLSPGWVARHGPDLLAAIVTAESSEAVGAGPTGRTRHG